jgi:2-methylcitrate synthase
VPPARLPFAHRSAKKARPDLHRGYSIEDLAAHASYEETAWLVLHGELPTRASSDQFRASLIQLRGLPLLLRHALETPSRRHASMDILRTGCSVLGTLEPREAGA